MGQLASASCAHQSIKPILVTINHRIGLGLGQVFSRPAFLSFLGEDTHPTVRQIFYQPCMVDIQSSFAFARPSVPGDPAWGGRARGDVLIALCFDGKTKCLEVEAHAHLQVQFGMVVENDVCRIAVVGGPLRCLAEQWPDLRGSQSRDDHFIGYKILGKAGQVAFWPEDFVHEMQHLMEWMDIRMSANVE